MGVKCVTGTENKCMKELTEEEKKLIPLIEAKGLSVDMFDPLCEALAILDDAAKKIKAVDGKLRSGMGTVYPRYKEPHYLDPTYAYQVADLYNDLVREYKRNVVNWIEEVFSNVTVGSYEIEKFLDEQAGFDPRAIMLYMFGKYGMTEDFIALSQIWNKASRALARMEGRWEKVWFERFEDLVRRGETGIVLHTSSEDVVLAISKFAEIIVGGAQPSKVEGWKRPERLSRPLYGKYSGNGYSMEYFKNNNVLIKFETREAADKFGRALFTEPEELVKMQFAKN